MKKAHMKKALGYVSFLLFVSVAMYLLAGYALVSGAVLFVGVMIFVKCFGFKLWTLIALAGLPFIAVLLILFMMYVSLHMPCATFRVVCFFSYLGMDGFIRLILPLLILLGLVVGYGLYKGIATQIHRHKLGDTLPVMQRGLLGISTAWDAKVKRSSQLISHDPNPNKNAPSPAGAYA